MPAGIPAPAHKDPAAAQAGHCGAAAVELRRIQPQLAVHHLQSHGRFGAASFHALSRHSPAAELERSDYAVSANIGRTLSACRQAVVDIRCCLDWLEEQGYEHFGVLGTSLGSCYAFLASAHDPRIRVNAFNHASTAFGDVTWAGQSTRHVRQALEEAGLTQDRVRALWAAVSPCYYYDKIASDEAGGPQKQVLMVYADYDLTFPKEYSLQVVEAFRRVGLKFEAASAALRPLHDRRNALQVH